MKIHQLKLENFRGYENETVINFSDLTVFVGRNDIGKSTILEALDIFFNDSTAPCVIKIEKDDVNKDCRENNNLETKITIIFSDLPESLTIDATNPTTLEDEYLLNSEGYLEIIKKYSNGGKKPKIFVKANHPTNPNCSELLLKKIANLKKLLNSEMVCPDKTKSAVIRKTIWDFYSEDLQLKEIEIELAKIDSKDSWEQLRKEMPLYSLFQSDRKNSDGDSEIQDPMKIAVNQILQDPQLKKDLDSIASEVEKKLIEVSSKTLEKLNEMNPEIASTLNPVIPSPESLKWNDVFKSVTITGDEDIPINKRGSGVKRLILLNFFRADAERRQREENITSVIYAIEEPETSQHPAHQRKLIEAFKELSKAPNTQIILTTHSPAIVKMLDFDDLQLIKNGVSSKEVINVERGNLPYPSLNEINFLAFGESNEEYHNELYGFLEERDLLNDFKEEKQEIDYIQEFKDGTTKPKKKILTEYIRHLIHHPENRHNEPYTFDQLQESIKLMRDFIKEQA